MKFTPGLKRELGKRKGSYVRHIANPGDLDAGNGKNLNIIEATSGNWFAEGRLPNGRLFLEIEIWPDTKRLTESRFLAQIAPLYKIYDVFDERNQRVAVMYASIEDKLGLFNSDGVANLLKYTDEQAVLTKILNTVPNKYITHQGAKAKKQIRQEIESLDNQIAGFKRYSILYWRK